MGILGQSVRLLGGAALIGTFVGVATTPGGREAASRMTDRIAKASDLRSRPPQAGDHWGGCDDAREAGTAPIYRGEPGYREGMDGDSDGIACEPHY